MLEKNMNADDSGMKKGRQWIDPLSQRLPDYSFPLWLQTALALNPTVHRYGLEWQDKLFTSKLRVSVV